MKVVQLDLPLPTDAQVAEAYARLGSIWKVGAELGISGQTAHKRLKRLGIQPAGVRYLSDVEKQRIIQYYTETPAASFALDDICREIGRSRITICKFARRAGLTDQSRQANDSVREAHRLSREGYWSDKPHPRGMAGKTHTAETKAAVSVGSRLNWATWKTFGTGPMAPAAREKRSADMSALMARRSAEGVYSRSKGGRRPDIGETYFRSSWEANYARYLNILIKMGAIVSWEYEPVTFWFDGVKRGTNSYRPDFRILHKNDPKPEYIEIKGWVTPKDRTKWRRMKKYHPDIKLTVVAVKEYRALQSKWASAIPEWESDKGGGRKTGPRKAQP